ncbi:uncharacterized protein LOC144103517 [Amblyomma americanum]
MAEAALPKRKRGPKYCCVVGCHNSAENTKGLDPPVKLYRFPGKWYEKERLQAWINAVRRVSPVGTVWLPKEHTRICSRLFVGNCKSDISQHPAYIPTIFPPIYRKKAPDRERAQRWQRRLNQAISSRQLGAGSENPSLSTDDEATMHKPGTSITDCRHQDIHMMDLSDAPLEMSAAVASTNSTSDSHPSMSVCGTGESHFIAKGDAMAAK